MSNHALDILNTERYKLKEMIRTCQRNSDIARSNIPYDEYEKQLREIELALKDIAEIAALRANNEQQALEAEEEFYTADRFPGRMK